MIEGKIKYCDEDVSRNIILRSMPLQSSSDSTNTSNNYLRMTNQNKDNENDKINQCSSSPTQCLSYVRSINSINRRKELIEERTETV